MTRKQRRLTLIGSALAVLGIAAGLVLYALSDSIVFFHGPTDVVEKHIQPGTRFRLGGLVKEGSLKRGDNQVISFDVTDTLKTVPVTYQGLLPDLFREGQGVVAEGVLETSGRFRADSVLAKHDENYMPKDVADALKKQGVWHESMGKDGRAPTATQASGTAPAAQGERDAMIVEIGHYALVLGLALALVLCTVPVWGAVTRDAALMATARPVAIALAGFVALSYLALTVAYVGSDFSVLNVVQNSHSAKPLGYKISGVWSNHEGSMLLWVLILAVFAGLIALRGGRMPVRLLATVLAAQGAVAAAFLLFILGTSNPFSRLSPAPFEGQGLNPILQDPGLAIHPPLLYLGYVGFSVAFSFAVGALVEGRIDALWARFVRPWTLTAWVFLTLGIAMGSYWAYYELGWGGWWFWDPVENASLMPWLAGTALLHSTVVMEKRDALKVWTILLSILTFSLSLVGTFLVRSGVLTSVHAFATDPTRGIAILAILIVFIGGSLALFAWRAPMLRQGGIFAPVSREGALVLNNLFLAASCAAVFIGTLYPLALEAVTGWWDPANPAKISVGAPFFNATFLPLVIPLLLLMPFGQSLAWKRGDLLAVAQRLMAAGIVAILIAVAVTAFAWGGPVLAPLTIGLGAWLILGSLTELVTRSWRRGASLSTVLSRAAGLPRSAWGTAISHAGVGVMVIGISATAWGVEQIVTMKAGDRTQLGAFTLVLEKVVPRQGPDYRETVAQIGVFRGETRVGEIDPGKRVFEARQMPTSEAGLLTMGLGQIYGSVGEFENDGSVGLRLYWKPLVLLIWLGAVAMALGGGLSLLDRRARIGAPVKARAPVGAVPAE